RLKVEVPVVYVAALDDPCAPHFADGELVGPANGRRGALLCHPAFPGDGPTVRELTERVENAVDLAEPFCRIREAVAEARKIGVTRAVCLGPAGFVMEILFFPFFRFFSLPASKT